MAVNYDRVLYILRDMNSLCGEMREKALQASSLDEAIFYQTTATRANTVVDLLQHIIQNLEYDDE